MVYLNLCPTIWRKGKWAGGQQKQQAGMCTHQRLRSASTSAQFSKDALRVAKGSTFQAESWDWSDWVDVQTDFNLRCTHIPTSTSWWIHSNQYLLVDTSSYSVKPGVCFEIHVQDISLAPWGIVMKIHRWMRRVMILCPRGCLIICKLSAVVKKICVWSIPYILYETTSQVDGSTSLCLELCYGT